ncbi:hypothetical protein [Ruminiclostridium cellulolyticum]|nr:hypothetical protein [Ruminiclostridium cellulolyticum]
MRKKWVKMVALILAIVFLITTLGMAGFSIITAGQ